MLSKIAKPFGEAPQEIERTQESARGQRQEKETLEGWILDISNCEKGMLIWLKMRTGATLRCLHRFTPSFTHTESKMRENPFN